MEDRGRWKARAQVTGVRTSGFLLGKKMCAISVIFITWINSWRCKQIEMCIVLVLNLK